ncbi:MAG: cohesin domain-containing protein, partial [Candidatus Latescibacterota bacterium]
LQEKYEGKSQSWYTWDMKSDFQTTGWNPVDGTAYIIYGVITENRSTGNTEIVYSTGLTFLQDGVSACQTVTFANTPFARLSAPPAEGITVNAEETYRMPFTAFDWDANGSTGIFIVKNTSTGFESGPATTTTAALDVAGIVAYDLTDNDGDYTAGGAYLNENSATYYDMTLRIPGSAAAKYTTTMNSAATPLADGTYWVYIGIDPDITDGGGVPFFAGTETLYRAPGPLTVVNAGVAAVQRNLSISPMEANVAQGDTLALTIKAADNAATIDRMDAFISVDKTWWSLVNPTTPFTAASGYAGKLIANTVIDDSANNRWILRAVVFDGGTTLNPSDTGLGDDVATFRLVSKGTTDALQHLTSVGFMNDPGNDWVTKFSNDGVDISINFLSSSVKVVPRGIVEGIIELQGRNQMNATVTFELRERSGYTTISDSLFYATNDADTNTAGLQFVPDTDGKFTLWKVPTGEYDLVAKYDRYLAKKVAVNVYPGVDTLFVSFGQLRGGDAYGYSDSLQAVYPDNQIDTGDINRVSTAFLATPAHASWNDGSNNWKWADINEDNVVEADDLALTTANVGNTGAQPVYKPVALPNLSNVGSMVEFVDVPQEIKVGQTYTIRVITRNAAAVRAYYVDLKYNTEALRFDGIRKGGFIDADSYSFPVIGEGKVGLANSAYGDYVASGDGVLAEVTFYARVDGVFDANMLGFEKVSFVNSDFTKEELQVGPQTGTGGKVPASFALGQNYPNPFNPSTVIDFTLPEPGHVTLNVYDMLGRNIRTLVSGAYATGQHSVVWDGRDSRGNDVSAGIYVYTIKSGKFSATRKMMFLK